MDLRKAIIHELANKISSIKNFVEVNPSAFEKEFILNISNLDYLAKQLLDLEFGSKLSEERVKDVSLKLVVENAIADLSLFIDTKGVNVDTSECNGIEVKTDQFLLERILYNLLHNAVKFSPQGSTVRVRCSKNEEFVSVEIENKVEEKLHNSSKSFKVGMRITEDLIKALGGRLETHKGEETFLARLLLPTGEI